MKVMLLAAGIGERMRPLTDHTPKPLLEVAGKPLLEHHILRLAAAGFSELVINVSHLGHRIMEYCEEGARWGVNIAYSPEETPLETAGGIVRALPLLGAEPFMVLNADVWTDYPLAALRTLRLPADCSAHLVLVDNPPQHPTGDFYLDEEQRLRADGSGSAFTYAGLGVYSTGFFHGLTAHKYPLRPVLDRAIAQGSISGEYYAGDWLDVGTPQRLHELDRRIRALHRTH